MKNVIPKIVVGAIILLLILSLIITLFPTP